jgi:hypothetical protein
MCIYKQKLKFEVCLRCSGRILHRQLAQGPRLEQDALREVASCMQHRFHVSSEGAADVDAHWGQQVYHSAI